MKEAIASYTGKDGKSAEIYKEGNWIIAKLMQDGKAVDYDSSFKLDLAEQAVKEWLNDTV